MTHWKRREELRKEREKQYEKEATEQYEQDLEKGREIRRLLKLINEVEPE